MVYISGKEGESTHLEQSTLTDLNVAGSVAKYCIFLHISEGSVDASHFSAIYPQKSVPSITVVGYNGVQLWQHEGFITAKDLVLRIERAWMSLQIQETTATVLTAAALTTKKSESSMSGVSNGTLFEQGSSSGPYVASPSNEEQIQDARDISYVQSPSIDEHIQDVQASSLVTSELLLGSSEYDPPIEMNTKLSEETHENYSKSNKDGQADSSSEEVRDLHTSVMVDTDRSDIGGGQDPEPQENVNSHYDERLSERRSQIISNENKKDLPDNKVNEPDDNNVKVNTFDDCENAKKPTEVHLSIRLPDGTSLQEKFSVTSTLRSVSDYVNENQASEIGLYDLAIPYPRKVFNEEDFSKALSELGMFNRQALIVVPRHQRSLKVQSLSSRNMNLTSDAGPSNSSSGGYFDYVKRALSYMNPFSYFGGSASSSSSEQSNERFWQYRPNPNLLNQPTEADRRYSSYSPSSSNPTSGSPSKNKKPTSHFGSNIHTLRHDEDDDRFSGRNAFWNGNSTQYGGDDSK